VALEAPGVIPLVVGSPGFAELASRLTGVPSKTIRNALSTQPALRARWHAPVPTMEACTHRVRWPGRATPSRQG
jgi:hypothetical protein